MFNKSEEAFMISSKVSVNIIFGLTILKQILKPVRINGVIIWSHSTFGKVFGKVLRNIWEFWKVYDNYVLLIWPSSWMFKNKWKLLLNFQITSADRGRCYQLEGDVMLWNQTFLNMKPKRNEQMCNLGSKWSNE